MNIKKETMNKIRFILIISIRFLDKDQHQDNKGIIFFQAEKAITDYQEL